MKAYYVCLQPGIVIKKFMTSSDLDNYLDLCVQAGLTAFEINGADVVFVGTTRWVWSMLGSDLSHLISLEGVKTHES